MGSEKSGEVMNLRGQIDNQFQCIQEDLDAVEKRLVGIRKELLGPQVPTPEDRLREDEKAETKGWLNRVVERLDGFRDQLGRIKGLEKNLKKSISGPLGENVLEEQEEPMKE